MNRKRRLTAVLLCCLMGITTFVGLGSVLPEEVSALETHCCGEAGFSEQNYTFADGSTGKACMDASGGLHICKANFPDESFRKYMTKHHDTNTNDGVLSVSEREATTTVSVANGGTSGGPETYCKSLEGIEYMTELNCLDCAGNLLTELDVSKNTDLFELNCEHNNLTNLDLSKNKALRFLRCRFNNLSTLDLNNMGSLEAAYCYDQTITSAKYHDGSSWVVDMTDIVGSKNLDKVAVTDGGAYDSATGIVTYSSKPVTTTYSYDTGHPVINGDGTVNNFMQNIAVALNNGFYVTFESNGGSAVETQKILEGETATEPTAPTKSGATFASWYSDENLTQVYDFDTAVNENITLYAKWTDGVNPGDNDPANPGNNNPQNDNQNGNQNGNPIKTGDAISPILWIALLAVLGSAVTAVVILRKKRLNS